MRRRWEDEEQNGEESDLTDPTAPWADRRACGRACVYVCVWVCETLCWTIHSLEPRARSKMIHTDRPEFRLHSPVNSLNNSQPASRQTANGQQTDRMNGRQCKNIILIKFNRHQGHPLFCHLQSMAFSSASLAFHDNYFCWSLYCTRYNRCKLYYCHFRTMSLTQW